MSGTFAKSRMYHHVQILICIDVKVEEHYLLETSGTVSCSGVVLASSWIIHWWRCAIDICSSVTGNVTGVQNGRIMWCPGQSQMLWNCVAATRRLAPGKVKLFSEWRAASQLHMRMRHLMCQLQLQSLVHTGPFTMRYCDTAPDIYIVH